jgi:glycosyltransferase involved in cell wall biosynthesis
MENFVLGTADYIITTTEPMSLKLIEKYPFINEKCTTITNGFDAQDFQHLKRKVRREKFTIAHVGYLYSATDPEHFLIALRKLLEERKEIRNLIRVLFVGNAIPKVLMQIKKFDLTDVVELVGYVSHKEGLEYMINSDVLLLTIAPEAQLPIAGKTYEYLAAKRPILAIVPEGPSTDLIRSTRSGVVVHPKNITGIKHTLFKLFQEWERGGLSAMKSDIAAYERKALTERLVQVFQCVIARKGEN